MISGDLRVISTSQVIWSFGPVSCVRYPLDAIEGDGTWEERRMQKTVLEAVDAGRVAELLYSDVIWRLLGDKWRCYGRLIFYWSASLHPARILRRRHARPRTSPLDPFPSPQVLPSL